MLADSLIPIPFWVEAVNTACYVLNRVLVTKPQNKTPYELLIGNSPSISFMRPFGCPLTILNSLDSLGKFDWKSDEGYLLGYSTTSKAFRSIKTATTPIESNKPLVKDEDGVDVDVHVYRSMISSLMYLTASRPDIMFAVCACARHQVTLKALHLNAVKRIFSDHGGASLDRKSTTSGCQFLGRRLISWQCKKKTIMANSTTEVEYVAAANCCGQVLWIQNQMMDCGFNFMNTKIHIDNESTISVIKNPITHLKTKHIEIRFHFIRDCYEKRLIEVIKIHTDYNVADILTKGFDVTRFNFLMMATLKYSDKHNMVAFLKKPNESVGFTEIVDFLKGTSLRTLANGIQELVTSIDNNEYTITEASVKSKLQLADATGEHKPLLLAMLAGASEDQGEGSANPPEPNPTPIDPSPTFTNVADEATTTGVGVETEGATTTTSGIDAGLDSGNIHESSLRSYEAPLHEGYTSGSAEDSLQLKELMVLVPKLVTWIDNLEKELHHTKNTYGKAVLTLVKRVKSLELDEGTAEPKDGNSNESAAPTTVFRDDETIAEFLVSMSQTKAKQKDKGKKVTEEEAEFVVQEDWEVEEEMKKLDEEEATKAALIQDFDDIQARIEADRLLAARLQEEEGEHFTVKREPNFFMILLLSKEVPCLTKVSCCNQKQTTNKNSAKKPNDDLSEACRTKEAC
ncbi:putative ribonuclease H-like domain-containing protein [Tanacetum coccineum]